MGIHHTSVFFYCDDHRENLGESTAFGHKNMSMFGGWFPKGVHNDKLFVGGFTGSMYAQPPNLLGEGSWIEFKKRSPMKVRVQDPMAFFRMKS